MHRCVSEAAPAWGLTASGRGREHLPRHLELRHRREEHGSLRLLLLCLGQRAIWRPDLHERLAVGFQLAHEPLGRLVGLGDRAASSDLSSIHRDLSSSARAPSRMVGRRLERRVARQPHLKRDPMHLWGGEGAVVSTCMQLAI